MGSSTAPGETLQELHLEETGLLTAPTPVPARVATVALKALEGFLHRPDTLGEPTQGGGPPLLLVAVSGGADSMVLLDALDLLRADGRFLLAVVHVHHGLRGRDADRDAAFVEAESHRRGLECHVVRVDTRARMAEEGLSLEEAARALRYTAFSALQQAQGARAVVVAHHLDDDVETLLMRLITGGSLHALAGMEPVGERYGAVIWRPFLYLPQATLFGHRQQRNLEFRQDATNLEDSALRNRVRLDLLPRLRTDFNPQVVRTLGRLLQELKALRTVELPEVPLRLDAPSTTDSSDESDEPSTLQPAEQWQFPVVALQGLEPRERWGLWKAVLRGLGIPGKQISRAQFDDLDTLVSRTHGTLAITLPGGMEARRTYGTLVFGPRQYEDPVVPLIRFPVRDWHWSDQFAGWLLMGELLPPTDPALPVLTPGTRWWEASLFQSDIWLTLDVDVLAIRTRRSGDQLPLPGGAGHRALKEWFIDAKLPALFRSHWPVVALESGQPVWVPGLQPAERIPEGVARRLRLTAVKTAHWG
ncbi:MAG: tRNA lysidine(34) synthetase TilS [bacterium]